MSKYIDNSIISRIFAEVVDPGFRAVLSYIALILGSMVSLVCTPFMLRMLGQAEFGLFSLVNTTIAYLTILDFGFGTAIVRYTARYRAEQDKVKEETLHGMFLILYVGIGLIAIVGAGLSCRAALLGLADSSGIGDSKIANVASGCQSGDEFPFQRLRLYRYGL